MPENVAQTVQKVVQDLVAPDLRELKTVVASNQKQTDQRFDAQDETFAGLQKQIDQRFDSVDEKFVGVQKQIDQRFEAVDEKFASVQKQIDQRLEAQSQVSNANFKAVLAAIAELKAQNDLNTLQAISTQ